MAVNAVPLAPGGGLTYLVNQARLFRELAPGWQFIFFASPRSAGALAAVVPPDHLIVPFERHPSYLRRLRWEQSTFPAILRDGGFDLAYLPGNYAIFHSPVPQVVVDHNSIHHAGVDVLGVNRLWLRSRAMRFMARATARRATSLVYLSSAFTDSMRRVGFPPPARVIPSGVSVDWGEGRKSLPPSLYCASCRDRGFALAVHNWHPHKRLDWLSHSWELEDRLRDLHLVVAGAGRPARAISSGRVHVLGGSLSRAEIAALYGQARVFLSASILEAFPLTPLEAMSFGVPCVLSDIGAHREVAGRAAEYFSPMSRPGLVIAVEAALQGAGTLAGEGLSRVRSYSWRANVTAMLEEFERAMAV